MNDSPDVTPLFFVYLDDQKKLHWKSELIPAQLNLLLDQIKAQIVAGQVKQESKIQPATNGDIQAVNRVRP